MKRQDLANRSAGPRPAARRKRAAALPLVVTLGELVEAVSSITGDPDEAAAVVNDLVRQSDGDQTRSLPKVVVYEPDAKMRAVLCDGLRALGFGVAPFADASCLLVSDRSLGPLRGSPAASARGGWRGSPTQH